MRAATFTILAALSVAGAACDSHQESVCQKIGDCSQGGDNDWIARCQAEADALRSEAAGNGCVAAVDAYYSCADSNYSCQGATATFPGCDQRLAELDACLAGATATTACAMLSAAEAACGAASADAGVPPACTAARDCQARCYLTSVANACAPRVDELETLTACAAVCPP